MHNLQNFPKETWESIPGFNSEISSNGNVKSNGIIRRLNTCSRYNIILLSNGTGKKKQFKVHRLVAKAFVLNPFNKPHVNHIDGDKRNNNYLNLEWVTPSENMLHSFRIGLHKPNTAHMNIAKAPRIL